MPWAMSAPTVASAVVMRAAATGGAGLEVGCFDSRCFDSGCFDLGMMLDLQTGRAAECADREHPVEARRRFPVLDKRVRACAFPREIEDDSCTAIAPTNAAHCAKATSA